MPFERNTTDAHSVSVEELGLINGGASDLAEATITGSYPTEADAYLCNEICDMLVYPVSGLGTVIVRTRDKRRFFRLDPQRNRQSVEIKKGEGYCYSADEGVTFVVRLESTPPWRPDQYTTVTHTD